MGCGSLSNRLLAQFNELTLINERATEWKVSLNIEVDSIINRDSELVAFYLENTNIAAATWGENQRDITEQFSLGPAAFCRTLQGLRLINKQKQLIKEVADLKQLIMETRDALKEIESREEDSERSLQ